MVTISVCAERGNRETTIKTPDAIQIAVGILYGASKFVTNDPDLKKVSDIEVHVLDDFLEPS
jgi:predicted nucleic acid-binding protein